jgi:hypothetical protein
MALEGAILAGYFLGGVAGALMFLLLEQHGFGAQFTLLFPALACLVAGFLYIRWLNRKYGVYPLRRDKFEERALRGEVPVPPPAGK